MGGRDQHVDAEEASYLVESVIRRREETRAAQKMNPREPVALNSECSKTSRKTIHNRSICVFVRGVDAPNLLAAGDYLATRRMRLSMRAADRNLAREALV